MIPLSYLFYSTFKSTVDKVKTIYTAEEQEIFEENEAQINIKLGFLAIRRCMGSLGHLYLNNFLVRISA